MKGRKVILKYICAICMLILMNSSVYGGGLSDVSTSADVIKCNDESGNLLFVNDAYYCIGTDGKVDQSAGVHYFDHVTIGTAVFDGFYYHDENGIYAAGNSYMVYINQKTVKTDSGEEIVFDGCYMVGNMGKLSAAPQVRYIDHFSANGREYDGFFYFNEYGRLVSEGGIFQVGNTSNGRIFDGNYYFGGPNGALVTEEGVTEEGYSYDSDGLVTIPEVQEEKTEGDEILFDQISVLADTFEGDWSIYVKNLVSDEITSYNSASRVSASLIKIFVMARTYEYMDEVLQNEADLMSVDPEDAAVSETVYSLLYEMITVSDNESFNELVRLQDEAHDFCRGAEKMNEYLEAEGYNDTSVQHTLSPSSSASEGLGGVNMTSVTDCGKLLEKIYDHTCVDETSSVAMLDMLLSQDTRYKIPAGVPDGITVANKTGENSDAQSDVAIVFGEQADYIICVICNGYSVEGNAISEIQEISSLVYDFIN